MTERTTAGGETLHPEHRWLHQRLGWLPGHWYSPYPDLDELGPRYASIADPTVQELPGIDLSLSRQLEHLDVLCSFDSPTLAELSYPADNDAYRAGDALVLLRELQSRPPRRVIEVGSGYSTALLQSIRRRGIVPVFDHVVIDPHPEVVFELIESKSELDIIESPLQDVDPELADSLDVDDVLFVDSSHVSKPGSDVNAIVFDWLPRLARGVRVHFHDVYFPFEYPWNWIEQGRAWSEAFVLRAFLTFNADFGITLFTSQLSRQHRELMQRLGSEFEPNGSSLWIERTSTSAGSPSV